MTDDEILAKAGRSASELVETQAAFDAMKDLILAKWAATGIDDVATREKYFAAVNAINMVRRALNEAVAAGHVAQHNQEMAALLAPERR
jgi:hypothetical protein